MDSIVIMVIAGVVLLIVAAAAMLSKEKATPAVPKWPEGVGSRPQHPEHISKPGPKRGRKHHER